jgi:hypothetical protein
MSTTSIEMTVFNFAKAAASRVLKLAEKIALFPILVVMWYVGAGIFIVYKAQECAFPYIKFKPLMRASGFAAKVYCKIASIIIKRWNAS